MTSATDGKKQSQSSSNFLPRSRTGCSSVLILLLLQGDELCGRELFKSDRARTSEKYAVLRHEVTTELSGFHLKLETLAGTALFTPTLTAEEIAKGRQGGEKKIIFFN